jgi:hypothetical protein
MLEPRFLRFCKFRAQKLQNWDFAKKVRFFWYRKKVRFPRVAYPPFSHLAFLGFLGGGGVSRNVKKNTFFLDFYNTGEGKKGRCWHLDGVFSIYKFKNNAKKGVKKKVQILHIFFKSLKFSRK